MEFNLNDRVEVKLTDYGKEVYEKHFKDIGIDGTKAPDTLCSQVWDLMNIFGPVCYVGNPNVAFVDNKIELYSTTNPKFTYVKTRQWNVGDKET